MFGRTGRFASIATGGFTPSDASTAVSVLRDWPEEVAAVIDSTRAGRTAAGCADAARRAGPTATAPVCFGATLRAGTPVVSRREHAPAA